MVGSPGGGQKLWKNWTLGGQNDRLDTKVDTCKEPKCRSKKVQKTLDPAFNAKISGWLIPGGGIP